MTSRLVAVSLATLAILSTLAGCGSDNDDLVASVSGATAPPDGTDGVCCPVSATKESGCIDPGGYSNDGKDCPTGKMCDNLGPYSLVVGDHGCKTWALTSAPATNDRDRPAPDGSPGVCCYASETKNGGCVFAGGYDADGRCPDSAMLCDNLGPYSVGEDDHGCKVWGIFAR